MIALLFWFFLAVAAAALTVFGDRQSKAYLAILLLGVVSTSAFISSFGWSEAQPYVLLVDSLILIFSLWLVSKTNSYWPIWACSFQSIVVATSIAHLIFPNQIPGVYINLQGFWFFPLLISVVYGALRDYRAMPRPSK
jgi:hypothetical protein